MLSLRHRAALLAASTALGLSLASTAVAWGFGFAKELGEPLWWRLYAPWAAIGWWQAWGHLPAYRQGFVNAVSLAMFMALALGLGGLRLRQSMGALRPEEGAEATGYGTPRDLLRSGQIATKGDGIVLGKRGRAIYRERGDGHALILGSPRSGKGVSSVIPTALSWRGSLVAYDPKGEIAAATRRWRSTLGPTFVLDATSLTSDRFNPLLELRDGPWLIGDAQMAAGMIAFAGQEGQSREKVWDNANAELLTTLIAHVRASGEPTLDHLARCAAMVRSRQVPPGASPWARERIEAHIGQAKEVRDSVNFTMSTSLAFLADRLILRATGGSDFRAADLMCGERPVTVYLTVPPPQTGRLRPLTRLYLQTLLAPLMASLKHVEGVGPKRHKLLCLLDEFHRLGDMDVIRDGAADMAGYGIRLALVCQDIEQLRAAYGPNQSLTGMCSTFAVIPGLSKANVEFVREIAGHHTVAHRSRQFAPGKLLPTNSQTEARVPVVNARDLMERSAEEILILHRGAPRAVWLRKLRYFDEAAFRGMHDPIEPPAESPAAASPTATSGKPWLVTHTPSP